MEVFKLASRVPIFPLFIGVSSFVGWLIPEFYAWTESDQSRPSPLLWKVLLWSAMAAAVFCFALPWLPISPKTSSDAPRPPMRFSVRLLLMLTAGLYTHSPRISRRPLIATELNICLFLFLQQPWVGS